MIPVVEWDNLGLSEAKKRQKHEKQLGLHDDTDNRRKRGLLEDFIPAEKSVYRVMANPKAWLEGL